MKTFDSRSYSVSDFLEWYQGGKLDLSPQFQRRSVWSSTAKSFLMDTIVRGKPVPKIIIQQKFVEGTNVRVVVDGQQRLRAVLEYFEDAFPISRAHNRELAGSRYSQLPTAVQEELRQYEIAVDVLYDAPLRELLDIFSRLNTYTVKLNSQELLNAKYLGYFKNTAFSLGHDYAQYWLDAGVLTTAQISRMGEAELASDLLALLIGGIQSNKAVEQYYRRFEEEPGDLDEKKGVFDEAMTVIGAAYPNKEMRQTCWKRKHMFYSVFCSIAHIIDPLPNLQTAHLRDDAVRKSTRLRSILDTISADFESFKDATDPAQIPERIRSFMRASTRATTDTASRNERSIYIIGRLENELGS